MVTDWGFCSLLSILCGLWPAALPFLPVSQVGFALLLWNRGRQPFCGALYLAPVSFVFTVSPAHIYALPRVRVRALLLETPSPQPVYKYLFPTPNTSDSCPLSIRTSFFKAFSAYFWEKSSQLLANICITLTLANRAFSRKASVWALVAAAAVVAAGERGGERVGSEQRGVRVPLNIRNLTSFPEDESKTLTR